MSLDRRTFLASSAVSLSALSFAKDHAPNQEWRTDIRWPRNRIPLSFIIDDSTCLVNLAHFAMPQFAAAWPNRKDYQRPWKDWPREIPDSFVREFGEWCQDHGVKGKYSIVPNPACVGWLDRELPGWSQQELKQSLNLVRELMVPNWDIHPEMITHTRMIDLKTGRPFDERTEHTMENWYPARDVSVDELASYFAYALKILKNCELPCEGITTPGGFGNRVKDKLPIAVQQAVKDVYQTEIPHYFKYVRLGEESVQPAIEKSDTGFAVNVPCGTGDWFGGWDGTIKSEPDRYCSRDARSGRMVELIEKGEPAIMLCHWPGLYNNGEQSGFQAFQRIVTSLESRFNNQTNWMKLSEIARYTATRESVEVKSTEDGISIESLYDCPDFTISLRAQAEGASSTKSISVSHKGQRFELQRVEQVESLKSATFCSTVDETVICFGLVKGANRLHLEQDSSS